MSNKIPIYAHRGASGYILENTIQAFEKAKELGADGIEIDVQVTKDNVLIVYHDLDLKRLAGVNKMVEACSFEELKTVRIGKRFWRRFTNFSIPSLQQVVEWSNEENVPLNIELKESLLRNNEAIIGFLQNLKLPKDSHFSSFHDELLRVVKMQRPDFQTAILVTKKFDWEKLKNMSHIDAVHAHKRYYKQPYFEYCKQANKLLRCYSIKGNEQFLMNPNPQVFGWITDFPDKVLTMQN
nr:glycerophosphodiester phosphodiesterase family protein [Lysinibacillus timonensis]